MTAQLEHSPYVDVFAEVEHDLCGRRAAWLGAARRGALAALSELGFPTTRQEQWKYTDVRPIVRRRFRPAARPSADAIRRASQTLQSAALLPDAARLVFVDGHLAPELSDAGALPRGATVDGLGAVLDRDPERARAWLAAVAGAPEHGFAALNAAMWTDGALIELPDGAELDRPLLLAFVSTGADEPVATHTRVLLAAGPNATATVVEAHLGASQGEHLATATTEIAAGPGARLQHFRVQLQPARAYHVGALHARLDRDSHLVAHAVDLGGRLVRNDVRVAMAGNGAQAELFGLYALHGRCHTDNQTRIDHRAQHTASRQLYRGVVDTGGRGVFNGKIVVHEHAQKTDARLANDNLLLSDRAEADTKPELEIYADDVKCGHGATVGQLSDDALFYLRARGLDEATARSTLVHAFTSEVVGHMAPLAPRIEELVARRLERTRPGEATP